MITLGQYTTIRTLHQQGWSIKRLSRELALARNTIRRVLRQPYTPQRHPASQAQAQARMRQLYRELMAITRAAVRQAGPEGRHLAEGTRRRAAGPAQAIAEQFGDPLRGTAELVRRVLAQTRALGGDTRTLGKGLSLFEPHTEAIRKGKAGRPTEVGKLVKLQEAEGQCITDDEVLHDAGAGQRPLGPPAEGRRGPLRPCVAAGRRRCGVRLVGERARRSAPRHPPSGSADARPACRPPGVPTSASAVFAGPCAGARGAKAGSAF